MNAAVQSSKFKVQSSTVPAHLEQIADYFDGVAGTGVTEVRCTVCNIVVEKIIHRDIDDADFFQVRQHRIRDAWQRHITPPTETDYQI